MSEPNGIGMRREDDWDRVGCLLGVFGFGRGGRKNNVDIHADQFGCRLLQLLDRLRPAKLNDDILALNVTEIAQPRPERLCSIRETGSGPETEISDSPNFACLLRVGNQRPRDRSAEQGNQLSPLSINTVRNANVLHGSLGRNGKRGDRAAANYPSAPRTTSGSAELLVGCRGFGSAMTAFEEWVIAGRTNREGSKPPD